MLPGFMNESRDHAENLQLLWVQRRVGWIHGLKGRTWRKQQTLDGEFSVDFRNHNISVLWPFGFVDDHQIAAVQPDIRHGIADGAHKERGAGPLNAVLIQIKLHLDIVTCRRWKTSLTAIGMQWRGRRRGRAEQYGSRMLPAARYLRVPQ